MSSTTMDMGGGSSMPHMDMTMQMYFQVSQNVTILFKKWHTQSQAAYTVTCLVMVLWGALAVVFKLLRSRLDKWAYERFLGPRSCVLDSEGTDASSSGSHCKQPLFGTFGSTASYNLIKALSSAFVLCYDYFLMLIAMTYNVGIFCSLMAGVALGFLLMGHYFVQRPKPETLTLQKARKDEQQPSAFDGMCCVV